MGRFATRSAFAAALCTGVAMVGTAVHGLLGVDAELQRSALAANQHRTVEYAEYGAFDEKTPHRTVEYAEYGAFDEKTPHMRDVDCEPRRPHHLS